LLEHFQRLIKKERPRYQASTVYLQQKAGRALDKENGGTI